MSLRVDLSRFHNTESHVEVELDDDAGRNVWMTVCVDGDPSLFAQMDPEAARALAVALNHYANEAER